MAIITLDRELRNLELEQLLLHILVFDEQRQKVISKTYPALFSSDEFKNVFKVIKSLNGNCDLMTVAVLMEQWYNKDRNSTLSLLYSDPIIEYWKHKYEPFTVLRQLKDLLFRRMIFERGKNIIQAAEHSSFDAISKDILNETNKILTLDRKLLKNEKTSFSKIAEETASKINTTGDIVETGFDFLNIRLSGLTRKTISSLLARPKHFKSSFCDSLISTTVETRKLIGLIISLEDPVEERVKRIIAPRLGLSLTDMRFKRVTVDSADIEKVFTYNLHSKLHIFDVKDVLTPEDAVGIMYDIKPDLVIIDHIQKFEMQDMVIGIIRAVKAIETAAIRLNCNVLITSQVSDKKMAYREDQTPNASDAQWTSVLYQSSAEMFSLYYQFQIDNNPFIADQLQLKILASRYAHAVGSIRLQINPDKAHVIGEIMEHKE